MTGGWGPGDAVARWVYGALAAAIVLLAFVCARSISRHRTHYPLLRVLFMAISGVYAASAAATILGSAQDYRLRLAVSAGLAAALAASRRGVR